MRSTLVSILLYLEIIWSTSFLKLWNNLAKPLGSFIDESNDFISATKLANKSPTSPVDLVLTSSKIESENSLILFWALAPSDGVRLLLPDRPACRTAFSLLPKPIPLWFWAL